MVMTHPGVKKLFSLVDGYDVPPTPRQVVDDLLRHATPEELADLLLPAVKLACRARADVEARTLPAPEAGLELERA